jgi:hypothetical protein
MSTIIVMKSQNGQCAQILTVKIGYFVYYKNKKHVLQCFCSYYRLEYWNVFIQYVV